MAKTEQGIPANLQPKAAEYDFDLEAALRSVVALRATVPEDAFTAGTLGTERAGSAVHIRPGLFLTIGYLITESESVWLTASVASFTAESSSARGTPSANNCARTAGSRSATRSGVHESSPCTAITCNTRCTRVPISRTVSLSALYAASAS